MSAETSTTTRPTSGWPPSATREPGLLPGDPTVPVRRVIKGLSDAGLTGPRGVSRTVRSRLRVRPRAGAEITVHRRVQLYRIDHFLGDGLAVLYLRFAERDVRAGLEPQLRLQRADHDGGELRGRGSRPLLRSGRGDARRRREPPDAAWSPRGMEAPSSGEPTCSRTRSFSVFRAMPEAIRALRARPIRGLPSIDGVDPDSTTQTFAALRLEIDNWRWAGVPFFIRTGKCLPITQTELRVVFRRPPRLDFGTGRGAAAQSDGRQARSVHGHPPRSSRPSGTRRSSPSRSTWTWSSRHEGGEGPTPYEVLLHAALIGDSKRFTRQDGVEQCWRVMQPLLDDPPPVHPYAKGSWGPDAADTVLGGYGRWHAVRGASS